MSLYDMIKEHSYKPDGKMHSHANREKFWENRGLGHVFSEIKQLTSFLGEDGKFSCRVWHIKHDLYEVPLCGHPECSKERKWQPKGDYSKYCSKECAANTDEGKRQRSKNMSKLNSDDDFQKVRKEGVERFINSEEYDVIREQASERAKSMHADGTLPNAIRRYFSEDYEGSEHQQKTSHRMKNDNPSKDPLVVLKGKQTKLERYGDENFNNMDKIRHTHECNYGTHVSRIHFAEGVEDKLNDSEWLTEIMKTSKVMDVAQMLGICDTTLRNHMRKYGITCGVSRSSLEISISELLDELGLEYVTSNRSILKTHEIDFYIPRLNIAIECNGTYWHSELSGKGNDYHLWKTNECKKLGIQLIHVWEYEFEKTPKIVRSRLRAKLGKSNRIYARKCEIKVIEKAVADEFMEGNHVQGKCQSSYNLGLYYGEVLVASMTFGRARFRKDCEWELLRYCSSLGNVVVGGASRLFSHFKRTKGAASVVSYSDNGWNSGDLYGKLGFMEICKSRPSYRYTRDYRQMFSRFSFQKHLLEEKLDSYDAGKTEWENMKDNGYDRIWDCGTTVWVYK